MRGFSGTAHMFPAGPCGCSLAFSMGLSPADSEWPLVSSLASISSGTAPMIAAVGGVGSSLMDATLYRCVCVSLPMNARPRLTAPPGIAILDMPPVVPARSFASP